MRIVWASLYKNYISSSFWNPFFTILDMDNINEVSIGSHNIVTIAIDTIHFYVTFIINLVFSFIIYLILVNILFENVTFFQWI
jgi:hypothetical protein